MHTDCRVLKILDLETFRSGNFDLFRSRNIHILCDVDERSRYWGASVKFQNKQPFSVMYLPNALCSLTVKVKITGKCEICSISSSDLHSVFNKNEKFEGD
jgi:hypothetical protein